jgi:hypothetical protein
MEYFWTLKICEVATPLEYTAGDIALAYPRALDKEYILQYFLWKLTCILSKILRKLCDVILPV